jgi:hypothetical protein
MAKRPLTPIGIDRLKPRAAYYEKRDHGAQALRVAVQPSGHKSFVSRFRVHGKPAKLTYGSVLTLPLIEARKRDAEAMRELAAGRDPRLALQEAKEKAAAAAADTLQAICEEFFRRDGKELRSARKQQQVLARLVYPVLGHRPISGIRRKDLIRLFDKIADTSGAPTADVTHDYLRRIFGWCATRDDGFHSPFVRGMRKASIKARARTRILDDDELRRVWKTAETFPAPFGLYIRFLLTTACRKTEAAGMPWAELTGSDWLLPPERNKTGLPLLRPLPEAAQRILAELPRTGPFVFSVNGARPLSSFSYFKRQFDKACGVAGWALHDLRRSSRSMMSRAGIIREHAEECLGHARPGLIGTYDRYSYYREKQLAYEALAALIERIVNPPDNAVALPGR